MPPTRLRAILVLVSATIVGLASLRAVTPLFHHVSRDERAAVDACEGSIRRALGSEVTGITTVKAVDHGDTWTVVLHTSGHDWTCEARRGPAGRWFASGP